MSIAFVSTMNLKLYNDYGKRFIKEFAEYASDEIRLFIIFEGEYPEELINFQNNIIVTPLRSDRHSRFINYFGKLYEAQGVKLKFFQENGQNKVTINPDYRFNAIRFSFKPFAIHQVLKFVPENLDYLIWTDADLRCLKQFSEDSLIKFLPDNDHLMSYLGRKKPWYSECGFLGFNLKNPDTQNFINRVIDIYTTGEIFSLEQWHDSWIWDIVREEYEVKDIKFKNISGKGFDKEHPFVNCGLEEFFDHLKGPERKKGGKSFQSDFKK